LEAHREELETLLLETWSASGAQAREIVSERRSGAWSAFNYYAWYGRASARITGTTAARADYVGDKPLIGYYPSSKGQTIAFHLDLFERMGLDYVIVNLHVDCGGHQRAGIDQRGKHLFEIARKRASKVRFAIQIAPYTGDAVELERTTSDAEKGVCQPTQLLPPGRGAGAILVLVERVGRPQALFDRLAAATEGCRISR